MNLTLIAGLKASARDFHAAGEAMIDGAARLEALAVALERETAGGTTSDAPVSYKRPDGRLSEAGIAAITAALNQGLTNAEIAAQLSVDASAVSKRRKAWLETQGKTT
ncbi:hypothetical protein BK022_00350 [Methylorubrum extorquens]|uniref:Uncharacterized protein n=1 Tax=Methylorubrum extorquens TaxID=408 RepID=A0A1S1PAK8_METEX|nr:hypothetical protein BK022_00350 [Methylorubrum extorquens]